MKEGILIVLKVHYINHRGEKKKIEKKRQLCMEKL